MTREWRSPYDNMEMGHRGTPPRALFLKAAMEQEARRRRHGTHWLWFFAAAILVIGPLEGLAIWLILR